MKPRRILEDIAGSLALLSLLVALIAGIGMLVTWNDEGTWFVVFAIGLGSFVVSLLTFLTSVDPEPDRH